MNIREIVANALKWMMAGRFAGQIVSWIATILVIRILAPADYGLIALAVAFTGFLALFEEMGFGSAIVQHGELEPRLLQQIFGLLILINLTLYALLWGLAPLAADVFNEPQLCPIIRTVGLQLLINIWYTIPDAVLVRRMDFRTKSIVHFVMMIVGSLLTLILAVSGFGVWSIVFGNLGGAIAQVLVLQYFARSCFRPRFSLAGVGSLARFGGYVTFDRLLWYVYAQSDAVIVGKLLGKELLGIYSVAMHLATLPMQKVTSTLNDIGFAAFSRLQYDSAALRDAFIRSVRLLALVSFPVFFGIASVAPEAVQLFLGARWDAAAFPLAVLSLVAPLRLLSTVTPSTLYGIGRADASVTNNLLVCLIMPASFAIGARWGLIGVSLAWAITYPFCFLLTQQRSLKLIGVRMAEYLTAICVPVLTSAAMFLAVHLLRQLLQLGGFSPSWILLLSVGTGAAMYIALAWLLQREGCIELLTLISEPLAKRLDVAPAT